MRTSKLLIASVGAALLLWSCDVKDPIYNTPHPRHGKVTVTADWSGMGAGIAKPASYTLVMGGHKATATSDRHTIDKLFEPDDYLLCAYNEAENITVSGTTATANYTSGTLNWLFVVAQNVGIKADTDHDFTVAMVQQVRELTLVIEPTGGTVDRITTITGTLSGVAGTLDIDNGTHGNPSSVALTFARITTGEDAGKWSATARLLGVTGTEQKLIGTITFTGGMPPDQSLESDLTTALANFNTDKKTPLILGGTIESPTESGFTATITSWNVRGGTGIAN